MVDAGHSRLKLHLYQKVARPVRFKLELQPFHWPPELHKACSEVLIMGTHARLIARITSHLQQQGYPAPTLLNRDLKVPIQLRKGLEGIGNDRLAQDLGASKLYPNTSLLVVSAGSALTIDWIDTTGVVQGGSIAPGWRLHQQCLKDLNENLLSAPTACLNWPGGNTGEALSLGWWHAAESTILRLREKLQIRTCIFTGGDGQELSAGIPESCYYENLGADAMADALGWHDICTST